MAFRKWFVNGYLNPLEVRERVEAVAARFPELCRLEKLPYETHGYWGERVDARGRQPMFSLSITSPSGGETKPAVMLMRSPHAREWINSIAVVEGLYQLVENYHRGDKDADVQETVRLLDKVEFIIVPDGNPDGALASSFDAGRKMWRKNLRPGNGSCYGVDCNRNYPVYFGGEGSSDNPCTEIYRGPHALSEPETANIAHLVERNRNILFAIDSHSSGEAIYRPHATGGNYVSDSPVGPAEEAVYRNLERGMNEQIATVKGTRYSTGTTSNHAGTSDEFFFFAHRIYGFDLECGTEFQPPIRDALLSAQEVVRSWRALGLAATGITGLDIDTLLEKRANYRLSADMLPNLVSLSAESPQVPLPKTAPNMWRRFTAEIEPIGNESLRSAALALQAHGFDVDDHFDNGLSVIASEGELKRLEELPYHFVVTRDFEQTRPL